MRRAVILTVRVVVCAVVIAASTTGIAYWLTAKRFVSGDPYALDGIVQATV